MGKSKLQTPKKQSSNAQNKDNAMEFTNKKRDDLWTPHHRNATHPDGENGSLHVQAHPNNDEPRMQRRKMVPGKNALYTKIQQPTIASWLNKTQVMTMLT